MDWAKRSPVVKQMDGTSALRAAQPGAIKVFRKYFASQSLSMSPSQAVSQIVGVLGDYRDPNLYVELFNECYQDGQPLEDYCGWTAEAVTFLHAAGLKVAGFGFSTGNPTVYPDAWLYLQSRGYAGVDAISMHEYWNGKNGQFTEWNALRHRQIHQWTNGNHPAFIITETGADAVEGGPSGWKLCNIDGNTYIAQLHRYGLELDQDDYVLGATVFGGSPTPDWANFSTDDLVTSTFVGLPPRTSWSPNSLLENGMTIEDIATKPQRDDPSHNYGIWDHTGIIGTMGAIRAAWADTPDWQAILEIGGEAVVIDSHGIYRPS